MLDFLLQWAKSVQLSGKKHSGVSILPRMVYFYHFSYGPSIPVQWQKAPFLDPHLFVPEQNAPPSSQWWRHCSCLRAYLADSDRERDTVSFVLCLVSVSLRSHDHVSQCITKMVRTWPSRQERRVPLHRCHHLVLQSTAQLCGACDALVRLP